MSDADLEPLRALVERLRAPNGCPWDQAQSLGDLRAYLLEEAYELADALDTVVSAAAPDREAASGELEAELGDLLFQAAFIGRLAEESGSFTLGDAIRRVEQKMIARHPHVFGDERLPDAQAVAAAWERRKLHSEANRDSLLAGVSRSAPALLSAYRLTQKAAGIGFDWAEASDVLAKIDEEMAELRESMAGNDQEAIREELGDLLFTVANLARKLDLDPEAALALANRKFRNRFGRMERATASEGKTLDQVGRDELETLWEGAKRNEKDS
jgi:ATP diphosphatase